MNLSLMNDLQRLQMQFSTFLDQPLDSYGNRGTAHYTVPNDLLHSESAILGSSIGMLPAQSFLPAMTPDTATRLLSLAANDSRPIFPTSRPRINTPLFDMPMLSFKLTPALQSMKKAAAVGGHVEAFPETLDRLLHEVEAFRRSDVISPMLSKLTALQSMKKAAAVGGRIEPFPEKLHRLLYEVEAFRRSEVISFIADDTFRIHDPIVFFREIVPQYFRQTKLTSFKRQLKLYGFELITFGPNKGGYRHEMFSKKDACKCTNMRRVAIKAPKSSAAKKVDTRKETYDEASSSA